MGTGRLTGQGVVAVARCFVAGVDGSRASWAAARWAAREADAARAPLRFVPAVAGPVPETGGPAAPHVRVVASPLRALLEEAGAGEYLVLGNTAPSTCAGFLTRSLSLLAAAHAPCPVVLVRAGWQEAAPRSGTALGLDPAREQGPVIDFAFRAAGRQRGVLQVLHAWQPPLAHACVPLPERVLEEDAAAVRRAVEAVLRPWRERYPHVPVRIDLRYGSPRGILLAADREAALTVVGRRDRHASFGPRLGSFAHTLIHRAAAPVAVVPHP